jgi:hypothetical protein
MNPWTPIYVMAGFTCVAIVTGWMAIPVWRRTGRAPRLLWVAAASMAIVLIAPAALPPGYSRGEHDRIERLHAQFAPALERYRQDHGAYPPTLEAAGIATPRTKYGPLRYTPGRAKDGTPAYSIAFGDYFLNEFTAWWDSESREWYLDS